MAVRVTELDNLSVLDEVQEGILFPTRKKEKSKITLGITTPDIRIHFGVLSDAKCG